MTAVELNSMDVNPSRIKLSKLERAESTKTPVSRTFRLDLAPN